MRNNPEIWLLVLTALAFWPVLRWCAEAGTERNPVARLRAKLGTGFLGLLLDCFFGLSLWFSLPLAIWLSSGWLGLLLEWQPLCGAVCLIKEAPGGEKASSSPSHSLTGDASCVVVKSEAS